jgi:hypothetical protein
LRAATIGLGGAVALGASGNHAADHDASDVAEERLATRAKPDGDLRVRASNAPLHPPDARAMLCRSNPMIACLKSLLQLYLFSSTAAPPVQ